MRDIGIAHAFELLHDFGHRRAGDVSPHSGPHNERARRTTEDELRAGAVRVAVFLTKIQIDTARKQPTQYFVHDDERFVVGSVARHAQ